MNNVSRVEELESPQNLIDEVLYVLCQQLLARSDHSAQISLHELADQINVTKSIWLLWHIDNIK